jgi:Zn-dependent protease with chaperone function
MLRALAFAAALALAPSHASAQAAPHAPPTPASAPAQTPAQASTPSTTPSTASPASTTSAVSADTAAGDTGAVAVPRPTAQAVEFQSSGNVLWVVDTLWSLLLPLVLLFTGLSARIRTLALRVGRRWYFGLVIYGAIVSLLFAMVSLPLAYYEGFVREHAYGLSNQTFGKWAGDLVKGEIIGIIGFALVMWLPYLLLRKSPRRWWLWTGIAAIPLIVATVWLQPIVVDPLFNHFGPMHDRALEARILAEASRAGIQGSRVFEVNKSVDTRALNAYVTGFGGSKRIVIWDTTIRRMTPRELLYVVGHEMGHYVLHHLFLLMGVATVTLLICLWLAHVTADALIRRWRARFGFDALSDFASYPLLIVIFTLATLVLTPVLLACTRYTEHEADRFGLELTRDNHACATAFVKLQADNLAVPFHSTLYKVWHDSHPPLGERIEFCNGYRPWAHGQPLKYGKYFDRGLQQGSASTP